MADVLYHDEIVVYRVIAPEAPSARDFLVILKAQLKAELRQQEILIVERDVETL